MVALYWVRHSVNCLVYCLIYWLEYQLAFTLVFFLVLSPALLLHLHPYIFEAARSIIFPSQFPL